ncbi:MAG: aminodeoxychorismate/anthranilate synthase component II [Pseudomonadota bacterium]|nr:aminodeoxychorismate/anthranilate synthase component II [Pseudomonadota bacterium]
MILLIDNYDSFTWNLVHLIGALGFEVDVVRNDALTAAEAVARKPEAIVLSPGPCTPTEAGVCLSLVGAAVETGTPLFGVCLGLQSIAQGLGGRVVRASKLMHGKTSRILHDGTGLFAGLPNGFTATRYHSLIAEPASLPNSLEAVAHADDDGEIMALAHVAAPVAGVQFHPESIASEHGAELFRNFLGFAKGRRA